LNQWVISTLAHTVLILIHFIRRQEKRLWMSYSDRWQPIAGWTCRSDFSTGMTWREKLSMTVQGRKFIIWTTNPEYRVLRATGVVLRTGLSVLMPASNNRISTLPGWTVDRGQPPIQRNVRQNSVTGGAEGKKRLEEKPVLSENSYHTPSCHQPLIMMMWATGFW